MPLATLNIPPDATDPPRAVRRYLSDAEKRVEEFMLATRVPAFVPSDYAAAYAQLRAISRSPYLRGMRFCEWGCGFGVVAGLADLLGFEASGIEIEGLLVEEARRLAEDHDLNVEFAQGSFVPRGGEAKVYAGGEYSWLTTESDDAYDDLGLEPADLDVVFAYPWPDEEEVTGQLFEAFAGPGAILATYHGGLFQLRRKVSSKKKRKPGR